MPCSEMENLLWGYACDTLSPKQKKELTLHLDSKCPTCLAKWQEIQTKLGLLDEELPDFTEVSPRRIIEKARRRAFFLRYFSWGIIAFIFTALLWIGLLIARYRYEHVLFDELEKSIFSYRLETKEFPQKAENLYQTLSRVPEAQKYLGLWENRQGAQGKLVDYWGNPIIYRFPGVHNKGLFDLYSYGYNGIDDQGEGDDIHNWQP